MEINEILLLLLGICIGIEISTLTGITLFIIYFIKKGSD